MNKSGVLLIVIGLVLLAHNLGWLSWQWLSVWWPLILVVAGAWSIFANRSADSDRHKARGPDRQP
ncbi:hypothetical protein IS481_03840 [Caldimonas thermodepolymerans]|jgi:hypothetical protein|uniref:LiaI-LiaF-like transmembrane region domain-containing protein n=1 Tax=Caldimonas thermodepolymerans TaxID=215580 RepID=A0A2S5T238_9BURK|nr:DUF5668 domain-containing protein [Caldimonas thermodepolymerans]PPE69016.1 hypothetical protein C1702_14215 [Caldimonas thermodepolymerans]QPC33524.1 hypothetical protein IS481_03840 [Caldimonas thermodepolymerans]RDH98213.1 hypothetical protein DES46_107214 [Caldimonas thermodepolymerans]TCP08010.1 hypothetical protein EV676_10340 [Caldimonas thermodepolymerans]UZG45117.1 DUF5668 domain-containing protein [Caldimonas thermodepolymerans]